MKKLLMIIAVLMCAVTVNAQDVKVDTAAVCNMQAGCQKQCKKSFDKKSADCQKQCKKSCDKKSADCQKQCKQVCEKKPADCAKQCEKSCENKCVNVKK